MDENRKEVWSAIVAALIGLGAVAIQYAATSRSFQIEAKARLAKARRWWESVQEAERVGERFAEWFIRDEGAAVVARADEITQEAADG